MSIVSLSTRQYLNRRLEQNSIHDVSDLTSMLKLKLGDDLEPVDIEKLKKETPTILLCSLAPLLTAITCEKVPPIPRLPLGITNGPSWLEVISWEPKIFRFHNFLTNEECEHLISLAKPTMVRSEVTNRKTGESRVSSTRTSTETSLRRRRDKIIENIENKISEFTFIPVENGEPLNVIRYEVGQKFLPHYDGSQRIATVLMYLSDVEEGGATVFPKATSKNGLGISVVPKKRDAILFWNMKPDGSQDPLAMHSGCPVIKGNKWVVTKWLRAAGKVTNTTTTTTTTTTTSTKKQVTEEASSFRTEKKKKKQALKPKSPWLALFVLGFFLGYIYVAKN